MQTQITRWCVIKEKNWSTRRKNPSTALQPKMIH